MCFFTAKTPVDVTVEPHSCICPSQSYNCRADSILGMTWNSSMLAETVVYSTVTSSEKIIDRDGVLVQFSDVRVRRRVANLTSHLFITDIHTVNGTDEESYTTDRLVGAEADPIQAGMIGGTDK